MGGRRLLHRQGRQTERSEPNLGLANFRRSGAPCRKEFLRPSERQGGRSAVSVARATTGHAVAESIGGWRAMSGIRVCILRRHLVRCGFHPDMHSRIPAWRFRARHMIRLRQEALPGRAKGRWQTGGATSRSRMKRAGAANEGQAGTFCGMLAGFGGRQFTGMRTSKGGRSARARLVGRKFDSRERGLSGTAFQVVRWAA